LSGRRTLRRFTGWAKVARLELAAVVISELDPACWGGIMNAEQRDAAFSKKRLSVFSRHRKDQAGRVVAGTNLYDRSTIRPSPLSLHELLYAPGLFWHTSA